VQSNDECVLSHHLDNLFKAVKSIVFLDIFSFSGYFSVLSFSGYFFFLFSRQMSTTNEYYQCRRRSSSADTSNVRLIFETVDRVIPASNDNDDHLASSHSESSKLSKLTLDSSLSISEECMTR
jgi:hypothetical protein